MGNEFKPRNRDYKPRKKEARFQRRGNAPHQNRGNSYSGNRSKPSYQNRGKSSYQERRDAPQRRSGESYMKVLEKNLYKIPNVVLQGGKVYTKNITPKITFFDIEETIMRGPDEYRHWDPMRSKLCAGLFSGLSQIGIKEGSKILYLGASHGYTPSFVSDLIGAKGMLFSLDFAPRVVKDLVLLSEKRDNLMPIMGNANKPDTYAGRVGRVEVIFQDIAQKNQVEIFLKNCKAFLPQGGFGILALKSRSVDVSKRPQEIFKQVLKELEEHLVVVDYKDISRYEKDHAIYVVKKK